MIQETHETELMSNIKFELTQPNYNCAMEIFREFLKESIQVANKHFLKKFSIIGHCRNAGQNNIMTSCFCSHTNDNQCCIVSKHTHSNKMHRFIYWMVIFLISNF